MDNNYDSSVIITKKLNATNWSLIEKPLTESERKRNEIILNLGEISSTSKNVFISKLTTIGEYYYLKIREELTTCIKLPVLKEKKDLKKKIPNKKTMMILDNCKESIYKRFDNLKKTLKDNPENKLYSDLMMNFGDYIEFRILILMKIVESATSQYKTIQEKEEILLGSKKIINTLKQILSKQKEDSEYYYFNKICSIPGELNDIKLCEQLVEDFSFKIDNLSKYCGIKLYDIANRRPKLIYDTIYDDTIPDMKLKPYDSQIELANCVKNNINNGFLVFYKTLPGLGKTSMILSICSFIKKSNSKLKVIFCCSDLLESVRVQVLRTMFNFGIRFGIATADPVKDEYKITNSWNCQSDEERELIVSDYKSTYLLLKESEVNKKEYNESSDKPKVVKNNNNNNNNKNTKITKNTKNTKNDTNEKKPIMNDYLLFFDEPTVLTDKLENIITLEYLSRILYYVPKHCILSSATLPVLEELNNIIDNYKLKYNDGLVKELISNKTLIGCFIKDYNSNVIVPHTNCETPLELKDLIKKIKIFPLLGKFYTLPFLMNLNEFCKEYEISINIDEIESFDHESILENIILLLERICKLDQKNFNKFRKINVVDIKDEVIDTSKVDVNYNTVAYDKILTSHAFKYNGCCLIASSDPLNFVKNNLYETVEKIKEKKKIKSITKLYETYLKDKKKYKDQEDKIYSNFTSEEKIKEQLDKLEKPKFEFDKMLEVNTIDHINMFSKYVKSFDETTLKNYISHPEIDISKFSVDDNLNFLLYMGVGIYTKNIDTNYSLKILEMLNNRELSYIIADETFCYGANYEISNVIICDDIGDDHSINTVLQLIGRTSRIGKSWSGKVYLDKNTRTRIVEFFKNPSFTSNEGTNIYNYFNIVKEKISEENDKKISDEIKKEENKKIKLEEIENKKIQEIIRKEKIEKEKELQEEKERIQQDEEVYSSWREIRDTPIRRINTISGDISTKDNIVTNNNIKKCTSFDNWANIREKEHRVSEEPTNEFSINISNREIKKKENNTLSKSNNINYDFSGWENIRDKKEVNTKKEVKTKIEVNSKIEINTKTEVNEIYRKFDLSSIELFKKDTFKDKKDNKTNKSTKQEKSK
jgi:hypothetical protein